ncbi:copper amine oxidase N-terminal domain-containing protein [Fervidibacter sacchari]|uniref:Tetratricopeptide (TPR) repeat protein n=1 Tax=Candidatus Fervidibacter sacchari TaxID=1448929 RepID=A0ABT2EUW3_9BACT|nr:copper amine oxidase N-terminal domain-containing protein [Candidatus Fervidibacter sacchari]MCS3921236.1 tetratricopeptide (TPR) repeat protein [Candidatus Fervidibacter sacchari]WKU16467.1 copper amine oxidase N-terminal domain-containing protein [Candidatus Fervidibacter sacchari]
MQKITLVLALQLIVVLPVFSLNTIQDKISQEILEGLRNRPSVHIPKNQKYPKNLEEAKRWVKESFCFRYEALIAEISGKPKSVWQAYYQEAARLSKGVFEKFGDICVIWLIPEKEWGEFGDIILYPEQIREDYEKILQLDMPPADPVIFYGLGLAHEAEQAMREKGRKPIYFPVPVASSPLADLQYALYRLGRWREAMEAIELYMQSLPWFVDTLFERWIECATKVYRKGKLPTKFLLVQNPKIPQSTSGGMAAMKMKGIGFLLRFKKGHHYVPISRLSFFLGWKVEREGMEIFLKTQDREVKLTVGGRTAYVNGFKVKLNGFVWEEGKEVWLPLQFVAMIGKGKLKWEKGKGFIQMVLPE